MLNLNHRSEKRTEETSAHHQTSNNESVDQSDTLRKTLQGYARKLANGPNDKAAKQIVKLTPQLSAKYEERLLNNFDASFRTNVENELWKNCFYASIEALRKQAGNGGPHSEMFRQFLLNFIDQAIGFYEELVKKYEQTFGQISKGVFNWPQDRISSLEELDDGIIMDELEQLPFDKKILRSVQRNLVYLGDLHRYKVQNQPGNESRSFSMARRYYLRAHIFDTMAGHPLNQLAVIARYEKKWIDVLFYYVRSLSVNLSVESARESLEIAFNTLRGPANTYEKWIWERTEEVVNEKRASRKERRSAEGPYTDNLQHKGKGMAKNYQENWIHPKRAKRVSETEEEEASQQKISKERNMVEELFGGENGQNFQKKAISHLLHCAGILVSTIGIEQFERSSQLALDELAAFIVANETILSPAKLLKIVHLFAFPVHSSKAGASKELEDEQKRSAIKMLLSIMGRLLGIVCGDLDKIGLFVLAGRLTKKFLRSLPSLCFLLFWFHRNAHQLFDVSLSTGHHFHVWHLFAKFCNKLLELRDQGELTANCAIGTYGEHRQDHVGVILPEFFLLSPYFDVLPKEPITIFMPNSGDNKIAGKDTQSLAVQARFALILHIAEELAGNGHFTLLELESASGRFVAIQPVEKETIAETRRKQRSGTFTETTTYAESVTDGENLNNSDMTTTTYQTSSTDEHELKKQLLSEEALSFTHRWIVEVRPKYLVPDTNTFIDHLDQIQLLADSNLFILLIPTIVIDELNSLTLGVPISGSTLLSREMLNPEGSQSAYLMKKAKSGIEWLRDASDRRVANLKTVTSNGNILQRLSFAIESAETGGKKRSNDDRILSVCVNLCKHLTKAGTIFSATSEGETQLERTVVLLTEDRGLSAKAISEKIPVRTIPNFTQWALNGSREATPKLNLMR